MGPQQAFEDKSTAAIGPFQPGSILNDRYRIEGPLGEGGFGQIFKAQDLKVHDKPVVVKVLSDHASQDEWVRGKFLKESEALARIRHPNVVEVLDKGATPEGKLFIVMQFVEGVTLKSALENGPLDLARTAAILSQAAEALTAAHERNVCHRDLKPANIMLRKLPAGREQAVLIDFGIAGIKDSSLPGSDATKVAGSLPYMAPEQLMGNPETASDIYSLGVIAYEMVTGRIPFAAKVPVEMYFQQQQGVQHKPSDLRPKFPAAADQAIAKALAFDAKNRYARALDFSEAFSAALSDTRETDTRPTPKSAPPDDTKRTAEMALVLFMDVVGYSRKTADQQIAIITKLQEVVRSTKSYRDAAGQDLISLPSGDGMALVFFKDPIAPVECALEVWRAVRQHPEIQLRMGINQGLVFRVADINQNRNVAGGGINMAQRVMDCGDAGHILVSSSVADYLSQLSEWSAWLHDLGECEVKHGVRVHIHNIYRKGIGNPARPSSLGRPWFARVLSWVPWYRRLRDVGNPARQTDPESRPQTRVLEVGMQHLVPIHAPAELLALIRREGSEGLRAIVEIDPDISITGEAVRARPFELEFPRDQAGREKPLELKLSVIAPDFEPKIQSKTIALPPNRDSGLCTFLLTPQHLGELRLTIEVSLGNLHVASQILKTHAEPSGRLTIPAARALVSIPIEVLVDVGVTVPSLRAEKASPTRMAKSRSSRKSWQSLGARRRLFVGIAALTIILGAASVLSLRHSPTPQLPAERTVTYYMSISKPGSNRWLAYDREMLVPVGYYLRFYFSCSEQGHLYLFREGYFRRDGLASFNTLFPAPTANGGSSAVMAYQELLFPSGDPMVLREYDDYEKLYMVWSSKEIPQLEELQKWRRLGQSGAVESARDVAAIRSFLSSHPPSAELHRDEENNHTVLNQTADPLVYMITLAHQ